MNNFFNIPPQQFALISSLLGIFTSCRLSSDEQNSLGNFLTNIGQNLMTVAAQADLQKNEAEARKEIADKIQALKEQISLLEKM